MPTPRIMAGRPYCWAGRGVDKKMTPSVGRSADAARKSACATKPFDLPLCIATSFSDVVQIIVRGQALLRDHVDGLVNRNSHCALVLIHPGVGAKNVILQSPQILQLQVGLLFDARLRRQRRLGISGLRWKIFVVEITEYSYRQKTN